MTEDVLNSELITKIDLWVYDHITNLYSPTFSKIIVFISWLNNLSQILFISILFLIYLFYKKMYPQIIFFTISILGSSLLFVLIKEIVKRDRPLSNIIEISGYSFPSGHATLSTTLAFCIYLIFKDKVKYKKSFALFLISYALIISFTRVYLHVHYLSDVIAGIGLGLGWVSLVYLIFIFKNKEKDETKI
jgi:undecaprenyl-diphosphatase